MFKCNAFILFQLIHGTVVDTSMVFPHRLGLPYKRALKNLMAEYLKKIIQDDGRLPHKGGVGEGLGQIEGFGVDISIVLPNTLGLNLKKTYHGNVAKTCKSICKKCRCNP